MIITKEYLEQINPGILIEDEIWKPIPEIDKYLEVSTYGNFRRIEHSVSYMRGNTPVVRHLPEMLYKVNKNEEGYLTSVVMHNKQMYCHRIVAIAFIPFDLDIRNYEVDHIDNNPSNPYYKNLQWLNPQENKLKSYTNVLRSNGRPLREIKSGYVYASITQIENELNIQEQMITYGLKHYNGYVPKYDLCFEDAQFEDIGKVIHLDNDDKHLFESRRIVIENIQKQGVRCVTTNQIFPTAISASISLNLPPACVSEVLNKYNGIYKKKNLKFEYVNWCEASDSEILSVMPHFISVFKLRSGGGKKI